MEIKKTLGWIALDIDGTITADRHRIPQEVVSYLKARVAEGWNLAIATGRSVGFAIEILQPFDFPYVLLAHNGAVAFQMPKKTHLFSRHIPVAHLAVIDDAFKGFLGDFLICSGHDNGYQCYWRPKRYTDEQASFLQYRWKRNDEPWNPVETFSELPCQSVPMIKTFGLRKDLEIVANRLNQTNLFTTALIGDPGKGHMPFLLVTDRLASKGLSLREMMVHLNMPGIAIAAGDDENDVSLLEAADLKIAMSGAPKNLIDKAHLIAPPASEQGIIRALELAIRSLG